MGLNILAILISILAIVYFNYKDVIFGTLVIPVVIYNWLVFGLKILYLIRESKPNKIQLLLLIGPSTYFLGSLVSTILFFISMTNIWSIGAIIMVILSITYLAYNGLSFNKNLVEFY